MIDLENDEPGDDEPALSWDGDFARRLIGATLLVDITYLEHDGTLIRREEILGRVSATDAEVGVTLVRRDNGEPFTMPPILEAIEPAMPESSRLPGAESVARTPDYTVTFSVTAPLRH